MRLLQIATMLAAACAAPGALAAQRADPPRRLADGLWVGATVGRGYARVGCDICRGGRAPAFSGSLRVGSWLSPRLLVGVEGSGWLRHEDQVDETIWGISAVAQYYTSTERRLFVKGGIGRLSYRIEDTQETLSTTGWGLLAGVGYELPVGRRLHFTPALSLSRTVLGGDLKFNGARILDEAHVTLLQIGLGITRR